jgi:hypothetical protein
VSCTRYAERQALAQWEREEGARLKQDREQRRLQREKIDREHYRVRLQEELRVLRMHERDTGTKMDADKVCRGVVVQDLAATEKEGRCIALRCASSPAHIFRGATGAALTINALSVPCPLALRS